jgi:hypothetical protein
MFAEEPILLRDIILLALLLATPAYAVGLVWLHAFAGGVRPGEPRTHAAAMAAATLLALALTVLFADALARFAPGVVSVFRPLGRAGEAIGAVAVPAVLASLVAFPLAARLIRIPRPASQAAG